MQVFFVDKLNNKLTSSHLSSIYFIIVLYCLIIVNIVLYFLTCHCCCGVVGWHCRTAESYAQNQGPCPEKSLLLQGSQLFVFLS